MSGLHRGIVVNDQDPEGLLRVRVQIPSLLGETVSNWAWPSAPSTAGLNPPRVGDPLWVTFEADDIERPVYLGTWLPISNPTPPNQTTPYVISGGTNVYSASASTFLASQVANDTQRRFEVRADGELRWGPGSIAADALLYRGGAGVLRTNAHFRFDGMASFGTGAFPLDTRIYATTESSVRVGAVIRGAAGQTANLMEWQNSSGTALISVEPGPFFRFTDSTNAGLSWGPQRVFQFNGPNGILLTPYAANYSVVTVQGAAGQTANLQTWRNSSSTTLSGINSAGQFFAEGVVSFGQNGSNTAGLFMRGYFVSGGGEAIRIRNYNGENPGPIDVVALGGHSGVINYFRAAGPVQIPLGVQGQVGQTADLQQWMTSAGTVYARIDSSGRFLQQGGAGINPPFFASIPSGSIPANVYSAAYFEQSNSGYPALILRGAVGQFGNIEEWQNSSGAVLAKLNASGDMSLAATLYLNTAGALINSGTDGQVSLRASSIYFTSLDTTLAPMTIRVNAGDATETVRINALRAGNPAVVVAGAVNQTANLQEWRDSAGSVQAYVSGSESRIHAGGRVTAPAAYFDNLYAYNGTLPITMFASSASIAVLAVRAAVSHSANLQEWQNSAGTVLSRIASTGDFLVGTTRVATGNIYNTASAANLDLQTNNGSVYVGRFVDDVRLFEVKDADTGVRVTALTGAAGVIGLLVKGAASQTADLLQLQNSAATVLAKVTAGGNVGINAATPLAKLSVGSGSLNDAGLPVQISTAAAPSHAYYGVNKNGAYGLLIGYDNGTTWTGAIIRQVTADPIHFIVNNTVSAASMLSNGTFVVRNGANFGTNNFTDRGQQGGYVGLTYDPVSHIGHLATVQEGAQWRWMRYWAQEHHFHLNGSNLVRFGLTTSGLYMDNNLIRDAGGGWMRTYGQTGWFSQTYGGGWWMSDTSYIRSYNAKSVMMEKGSGAYYTTAQAILLGSSNSAPALSMWGWNTYAWLMLGGNTYAGFVNLENSGYIAVWASQFGVGSAAKTKFDIAPLAESPAELRTKFKKLRPIRFKRPPIPRPGGAPRPEWAKKNEDTPFVGFTAEEMDAVFPEAVLYDEDGAPAAIDYSAVTAVLARMLIDVDNRLDRLEAAGGRPA